MTKIPLGRTGKYAEVDDQDCERVNQYRWYLGVNGYVHSLKKQDNKIVHRQYLHRFIMEPSKAQFVDHINHNPLDNKRSNLRVCSMRQNNTNVRAKNKHGRFKGVEPKGSRWHARITINRKTVHLGTYDTPKEAALAYNRAASKANGKFACLNVID
jgi:hypothetical protein